jgi:hypothetical protein
MCDSLPSTAKEGLLEPSQLNRLVEPVNLQMASEQEEYLAVLKASYDYEPQSEDEIPMKEDQVLFLLERTDEE